MTANVRCTGRRPDPHFPGGYLLTECAIGPRPAWKGPRLTIDWRQLKHKEPGAVIAKPCPRCGAPVELIPTGGDL